MIEKTELRSRPLFMHPKVMKAFDYKNEGIPSNPTSAFIVYINGFVSGIWFEDYRKTTDSDPCHVKRFLHVGTDKPIDVDWHIACDDDDIISSINGSLK